MTSRKAFPDPLTVHPVRPAFEVLDAQMINCRMARWQNDVFIIILFFTAIKTMQSPAGYSGLSTCNRPVIMEQNTQDIDYEQKEALAGA
jgi:hypothetical protein